MSEESAKAEWDSLLDFDKAASDVAINEGLRLVKAFIRISDPETRTLVVELLEKMAGPQTGK
jgi:hypothetical protein